MADVTVSELATSVGASVDRILTQMKQAGLSHQNADDVVSDVEKQTLLSFLKTSHGATAVSPKKITLKRKTTSTLKTGSGSSRKTVNVEVRKKRTYVKRDAAEPQDDLEEQVAVVEEVIVEPEIVEVPEPEPEPEVEVPEEVAAEVEEAPIEEASGEDVKPAPLVRTSFACDAEELRQKAILARRAEAAKTEQAKKDKAEKRNADAKPAQAAAPAKAAPAKEEERHKHLKKAKLPGGGEESDDKDSDKAKHRKTAGKAVKKVAGPKKGASALDYVEDKSEIDEVIHTSKRKRRLGSTHVKRSIKVSNKHGFKRPTDKIISTVELLEDIAVSDLAGQMNVKAGVVIKQLMKLGTMATMNQSIDRDTAQLVIEELGHNVVLVSADAVEEELKEIFSQEDANVVARAPIVTVMGHVDHGKTSLLDYIRKAKVTDGEAGGITQHIGAYRVHTDHGELTFLDTPGHAAFTAMRARGAQCTDIVILVVAADDGVMPQTEEAIQHARAAGVPIVVAINKIDKESADPDKVKNELAAKDVIPDDWGGDTQFIPVSAITGEGIEALLEAVALQSELLELKAPIDVPAAGVVVEARIDKGRGVVATVLVQNGHLKPGDIILAGQSYGRVRAMNDETGKKVMDAGPSIPVEILGLDSAPNAGDEFVVVPDEKKAREVVQFRNEKERNERQQRQQAAKLENMFAGLGKDEVKVLPIVIKTDVRGSLEAIQSALLEIGNEEVQVNIIAGGVGGITENDVNLALTSGAIVIGFNVRAAGSARKIAEKESIEIRYYSIIYQLIDEVRDALSGMLDPERVEEIIGIADVRDVFRSPKFGQVAGCMVIEGTVYRNKPIRVLRDDIVIYEGELESLRRFKDDVNDVRNGTECGIGVKNYDVQVGDQIEVFDVKEVARSL